MNLLLRKNLDDSKGFSFSLPTYISPVQVGYTSYQDKLSLRSEASHRVIAIEGKRIYEWCKGHNIGSMKKAMESRTQKNKVEKAKQPGNRIFSEVQKVRSPMH